MNQQSRVKTFDSWEPINLRLSVFLVSADDLSSQISWQPLFGTLPDSQIAQPKIGVTEATGRFEKGQLVLLTAPGRVDLIYQPCPADAAHAIQTLSNASEATKCFVAQANAVLQKLKGNPEIQIARLAFGAELLLQTQNKEDSYRELKKFLHSVKVDLTSSDLQYGINRKRKSQVVANLEINRLCQWSAIRKQGVVFSAIPHLTQIPVAQISESYACRLVLDINTVPGEQQYLPKDDLEELYAELVKIGTELAEVGDVP